MARSTPRSNSRAAGVLTAFSSARSQSRPSSFGSSRTKLTVYEVPLAGLADPSATTGTVDGHFVENDGHVLLEFNNASASARTVTIQTPATLYGLAVEDWKITIPANASRFKSAELDTALFNRSSGLTNPGTFYLDYPTGQHSDITVRAFSV